MKTVGMLSLLLLGSGKVLASEPVDLPVTRVAVFSSGVAYFETGAVVEGDATAELKFRTAQINDILKSLIVQDLDGGTVGAVSYASQDPLEKTLRSFGVDLTGKPTLAQLLDQLRGEPVEIGGPRAIKGTLLGVEKLKHFVPAEKTVIESDVVNILTAEGITQVGISDIQTLRLTNEQVNAELQKALAALAGAHDADKKSVEITFNGTGKRQVRAAYLLESPIWKTSYRLSLSEKEKPFIQGWATVENATEEDWKDVNLSLISGRPISFRMDLYTPLYVNRPIEELELYASLRPPSYEGAFDKDAKEEKKLAAREAPTPSAAKVRMAERGMRDEAAVAGKALDALGYVDGQEESWVSLGLPMTSGIQSVANAADAGELFEYAIKTPVSIPRQNSAMLPIVNQSVEAAKVSIYNPGTHPKHPLNGLELVNTSGLNLMQGPVTVFDSGVYAGDAKLPDLKPDEKRLVAYALDLACEVMIEKPSMTDELLTLRIAKGTLVEKRKYVDSRTYVVKNKDDKGRTVLLEQPYNADWTLIEPKEPYEKTPQLLRFKLDVAAAKTASQKVTLERVGDTFILISNLGLDRIQFYLRNVKLTPGLQQALERIVALRVELDGLTRQIQDLDQQINESVQDQNRVRENVKTLQKDSDGYKRQVKKLDDLETRIEQLREQVADLRKQEEQKRKALDEYLLSLNVE